jgi:hypothetical protein
LLANIWEDVSGKRIKCADFEGFTPKADNFSGKIT